MSVSTNFGGGVDPTLQTYTDTEIAPVKPGSDNTWVNGSVSSLHGSGKQVQYLNLPGHPSLVAVKEYEQKELTQPAPSYPVPDSDTESFNIALNTAIMADTKTSGGMTTTQAAQVYYYFLHPTETPPPSIKELMDKMVDKVKGPFIQMNHLAADWKPNEDYERKMFDSEVGTRWDAQFEAVIRDNPDRDKLRYEHYNRAPGAPLTAEEKTALQRIQHEFGVPDTYIPTANPKLFNEQINLNYAGSFTALLKDQTPPLSESDQAKLEYMLYHPDAEVSADLKAKFASLNAQAQANVSGLPAGAKFNFVANSKVYDAGLNGFFNEYQDKALADFLSKNQTAPWTEDNAKLLKQFLAGTTSDAPDFVKAAAASIKQSAIDQVIGQFHLEGIAWSPAVPGTFVLNSLQQSIISTLDEVFNTAQGVVNGLPDSPYKTAMLNILMRISMAMTELKQAIYESMGTDSAKTRELSRAKLDIALSSIKEQLDGSKEVTDKKKKAGDLGNGVNIINAIFSFLTILVSIAAGPLAMALAIMNFIDQVDPKANLIGGMIEGVGNAVGDVLKAMGANPQTVAAFQDIAKVVFVMFVIMAGGIANAISLGPQMMEMTNVIKDISKACGASEEEADKANKYFWVAVGIAATIAMIVAGTVLTMGAGTGPLILASLGRFTQIAMKVAAIVQITLEFVLQVTMAGMSIARSKIEADISTLQGRLEESKIMSDAEIQEIMKLIKKLLAIINGSGEFVAEITDSQKNLHRNDIQSIAGLGGNC